MSGKSGFSLVELVIVLVIIGILAVVVLPKYLDLTGDAKLSALKGTLGNMRSAIHVYSMANVAAGGTLSTSFPPNSGLFRCVENATADSDLPADPYMNVKTVTYSTATPLKGAADGTTGGWKYNYQTGEIICNHTSYDDY